MVVADFPLLCIEADTLADDSGFRAGEAPDCEGHFKAYGEDALTGLAGAGAEGMPKYESCEPIDVSQLRGNMTHLPANLLAEVVPSCSGGT